MIAFNKPFLPPKKEYDEYLQNIWHRNWLTNNGPMVQRFECNFKEALNTQQMIYVVNGTMALQLAIRALRLSGDVITTPFSFVATTSSLVWEHCTPVFVDIRRDDLNIDPTKIEAAITDQTTAILATHVFGNTCQINAIQQIADKYNLKVIYDASHCYGTLYNGESILNFGDISTISFHSTKLLHSIEGGGIFTSDDHLAEKLRFMRNFGHDGVGHFSGLGINAKNSELHAAMGLANLKYGVSILKKRKKDYQLYAKLLCSYDLTFLKTTSDSNYAYLPVLLPDEAQCLGLIGELNNKGIGNRRYFHPLLNDLSYVSHVDCPVAQSLSSRILCLPLYYQLQEKEIVLISEVIKAYLNI